MQLGSQARVLSETGSLVCSGEGPVVSKLSSRLITFFLHSSRAHANRAAFLELDDECDGETDEK